MLAAAMRQCFGGRHVYVVIPSAQFFSYCVPILQDMGATRVRHNAMTMEFGVGCEIHFLELTNSMIMEGFQVRGVHAENVFWDHEAVRKKYNQIIQRFHEYD